MSRLGSVLTQAAEDSPITFDVDDIRRRVVRRRRFRNAAGSSVGMLFVAATVALVMSGDGGRERIDAVDSPEGSEGATDPAQGTSARIELDSTTVAAGETLSGRLVVTNNTGHDVKVIGCGSIFQVALANDAYEPEITWPACAQEITVPDGESTYPMSVQARRNVCTNGPASSSTPTCEPDGSPPPLPPGDYEARLYQGSDPYVVVPDPPPVDVRVTG